MIKAAGEYASSPPLTMKSLRSRKTGLVNLVDTILLNIDKVGGVRLEVRSPRVRETVGEEVQLTQDLLEECWQYMSQPDSLIKVRKIQLSDYRDFLRHELKAAIDHHTFRGMRDSGPEGPEWAWLLGNIGISSGQFARHLSNGVSCQTLEAQPRRRRRASTPKSTPNPTPKKVSAQRDQEPPSPPPQAPPAHVPPPPPPPASLVAPGFQEVDMTSPLKPHKLSNPISWDNIYIYSNGPKLRIWVLETQQKYPFTAKYP